MGKTIAVVVEAKFIPEEINAYRYGFAALGAEVIFVSRLWGQQSLDFWSDVDPSDQQPWETPDMVTATVDIEALELNRIDALLMSANYTSVRLRYNGVAAPTDLPADFDLKQHMRTAPVPAKFAEAMADDRLIKGFLCHGLWILTPYPELLKGKRVCCNEVVAADIYNCGAQIDLGTNPRVVVDGNIVTAYSKHEVLPYIDTIVDKLS